MYKKKGVELIFCFPWVLEQLLEETEIFRLSKQENILPQLLVSLVMVWNCSFEVKHTFKINLHECH